MKSTVCHLLRGSLALSVILSVSALRAAPSRGHSIPLSISLRKPIGRSCSTQYRVRLMDDTKGGDCAYLGVEVLPDGAFVTTTYGHWTTIQQPYIVSVRLKLGE